MESNQDAAHHVKNAAKSLYSLLQEKDTQHEDIYKTSIASPFDTNARGTR